MGEFVTLEVADGIGTIRLNRPPVNALNDQLTGELAEAARAAAGSDEVRAVIIYGGEKVFAAGADIKEMAEASYAAMASRPIGLLAGHDAPGRHSQAGGGGHRRLRPRRRARDRAHRRLPGRGRGRPARPARDPAGHHPRRRRDPAPGPAGGAGPGQGPDPHRAPEASRQPRPWPSAWSTTSSRTTRSARRPRPGAALARGPALALARPSRPSTRVSGGPGRRPGPRAGAVRRAFRTEDHRSGIALPRTRTRQSHLHRPLTPPPSPPPGAGRALATRGTERLTRSRPRLLHRPLTPGVSCLLPAFAGPGQPWRSAWRS